MGGEGFGKGFVQGAGFGVEEGGVLGVAVEEEDAEGYLLRGGGNGVGGHGEGVGVVGIVRGECEVWNPFCERPNASVD